MIAAQQISRVITALPGAAGVDESLPRGAEVLLEALVHEGGSLESTSDAMVERPWASSSSTAGVT